MNKQQLASRIWASANNMRSKIEANEYKDYILGFIFYKFLSNKIVKTLNDELVDDDLTFDKAWKDESMREDIKELSVRTIGYFLDPNYLFESFVKKINVNQFSVEDLKEGIKAITSSTIGAESQEDFADLFEDMDLDNNKLGKGEGERSKLIGKIILKINDLNLDLSETNFDILGHAYEYLIGKFAASAGKKAGEFYTPQAVSTLITRIVTSGKADKHGYSIYDPCMGSGSLLLQAKNYLEESVRNTIQFFGQERSHTTYNLARMNMILHHVPFTQQHFRNGDTLGADWPTEEPTSYDSVVMNPPYSQAWSGDKGFMSDQRFQPYEKLAPKGKADFAFLLHGFYHLKNDGTMGIVLPHGVLFRGAAEGVIRKHLLENGSIYAVIGMPANIFFSTGIPTCVVILKKNRDSRDVLFIDASKEFKAGKAQNVMEQEHIDKIVKAYHERKDVEKFAHLASFEEIQENDFNLNIPRYVDTFEEEELVDIAAVQERLKVHREEADALDKQLAGFFKELGL